MKIHFLGTNGWYDTYDTGNTICTLIESKEGYIIFDAGFGIYRLDKYIKDDRPIFLFLSHFHMDHVCGFHVLPKFRFKQPLAIIFQDDPNSKRAFTALTSHPLCATIEQYSFPVKIVQIQPGGYIEPLKFECLPLQHADSCLGYRLYLEDKIITYCSDTAPCENDLRLAQNADILIHECALVPGKSDFSWGHSNPAEAAEIAKQAKAKKLILTHFGANSYVTQKKRLEGLKVAKKVFINTIIAKDNLTIKL